MSRKRPSKRPASPPRAPANRGLQPDRPVLVLSAAGLAVTAYLSYVAFSGEPAAFCTEGSACDIVQSSRFSRLLGLPIALWGFGLYALIAVIALFSPPKLTRWRRLTTLAVIGTAISLYLTGAGIVALDAACGWCLSSTTIMLAILVVLLVRRPETPPATSWPAWGLHSLILALVFAGGLHAWQTDLLRPENPRLKALASHLDESGAAFYGAFWCPSCQEQKRLFGASADRLPYIECTPEGRGGPLAFDCLAEEIRSYPTWIINGRRLTGVQQPEELARHSGFDWAGFDSSRD